MGTSKGWFIACAVVLVAVAAWATKFCPMCGREYPDAANYCNYCEPRQTLVAKSTRPLSARELYEAGNYVDAAHRFKRILEGKEKYQDKEEAALYLGLSFYRAGGYDDSVVAFLRFKRDYPSSTELPKVIFLLQMASLQMERYNAAKSYYKELVERFRSARYVYLASYENANAEYLTRDFASAIESTEAYGPGAFDNRLTVHMKGLCLISKGIAENDFQNSVKAALSLWEEGLMGKGTATDLGIYATEKLRVKTGLLYYETGDYAQARAYLSAVSNYYPNIYSLARFALICVAFKEAEFNGDFARLPTYVETYLQDLTDTEYYWEARLALSFAYGAGGNPAKGLLVAKGIPVAYEASLNHYSWASASILNEILDIRGKAETLKIRAWEVSKRASNKGDRGAKSEIRKVQQEIQRTIEDVNLLEKRFTGYSLTLSEVNTAVDYITKDLEAPESNAVSYSRDFWDEILTLIDFSRYVNDEGEVDWAALKTGVKHPPRLRVFEAEGKLRLLNQRLDISEADLAEIESQL